MLAGTEPEELATAVTATLRGSPGIALGDVIGANIAICLVALDMGAVIAPLPFRAGVMPYDLLGLPLGAVGAWFAWDGKVDRILVRAALRDEYKQPIHSERWEMPAGAFGEASGPS